MPLPIGPRRPLRPAQPRPAAFAATAAGVLALAVGLGCGVATSYLQGVLPNSVNFLANSGAVWSVLSYAVALAVGRRALMAVLGGFLALFGEVLGYYAIACPIRHVAVSTSEWVLWTTAAVLLGPVIGYLAWRTGRGPVVLRLVAVGAICGVIGGEGIHALVRLSYAGQGGVECAVAVLAYAAVAMWIGRAWWQRGAGLATGAVMALLVFAAYAIA